ncbi:hypothetical protein [Streptomyces avicenniae]|uniref:hypothetical protein n=1 Tax=Streptomyces avicenniae TaxID=500153 RepID=UPI000699B52A|nr:hypothetical protein [Streptomyces avicenniae]
MTPHASRLFPGGGGRDDTVAAGEWAGLELERWGRQAALPVVHALIAAARTRRPWWLGLTAHPDVLHAQILRAKAATTPRLPDPLPGAAHLTWTYGTAPTLDGVCMWTAITPRGIPGV